MNLLPETGFPLPREGGDLSAPPLFRADAPWLAPLAGWSDLPFRLLCRELGAAVCCTEMISAKGLIYGSPGTRDLLRTLPGAPGPFVEAEQAETRGAHARGPLAAGTAVAGAAPSAPDRVLADAPLVVQLFGSEAPFMEAAVARLMARGFRWFDCNMGCSVPKVTRGGAGAALCRDVDNALAVAEAMLRAAGPGRVGFKLRLGWDAPDAWRVLARELEARGAGWLTLHPRTAKQGFGGAADWAALAELKALARIPVVASGDLFTAGDGLRCLEQTGVDTVMYARGALRDPGIFAHHAALLRGAPAPALSGPELKTRILRHAQLARAYAPHSALLQMRTIVPRYVHLRAGARALRLAIIACRTWPEFERALNLLDA